MKHSITFRAPVPLLDRPAMRSGYQDSTAERVSSGTYYVTTSASPLGLKGHIGQPRTPTLESHGHTIIKH